MIFTRHNEYGLWGQSTVTNYKNSQQQGAFPGMGPLLAKLEYGSVYEPVRARGRLWACQVTRTSPGVTLGKYCKLGLHTPLVTLDTTQGLGRG